MTDEICKDCGKLQKAPSWGQVIRAISKVRDMVEEFGGNMEGGASAEVYKVEKLLGDALTVAIRAR